VSWPKRRRTPGGPEGRWGTPAITATYGGNANNAGSSGATPLAVNYQFNAGRGVLHTLRDLQRRDHTVRVLPLHEV